MQYVSQEMHTLTLRPGLRAGNKKRKMNKRQSRSWEEIEPGSRVVKKNCEMLGGEQKEASSL